MTLMEALKSRKPFRIKSSGTAWMNPIDAHPHRVWTDSEVLADYELKPGPSTPRTIWLNEYSTGLDKIVNLSAEEANFYVASNRIRVVEFREVMDELRETHPERFTETGAKDREARGVEGRSEK